MESVGDAVVIWSVVGLEEKVLVDQSVVVVQECVYVFGLHVEEVVGEREEWRFLPARVVEELKVEVRKLMESARIVAWPGLSKSIDSFGCQIAC